MWLIENFHYSTCKPGHLSIEKVHHAVCVIENGKILFIGNKNEFEQNLKHKSKNKSELYERAHLPSTKKLDLQNRLVTPGLIDCHTHLCFAGSRSHEFERRLSGETYSQIAQTGGGILSTVVQTRKASLDELVTLTAQRLAHWQSQGVTTLEIKSGYGLNEASEYKILEAIKKCVSSFSGTICPTFLGAHALAPEFKDNRQGYIDLLCHRMIPHIAHHKLATAVDVFCESIGFSTTECARIFDAAQKHKLAIKAHVEQLSLLGGAQTACSYGALSCDHIEYLDEAGAKAMQQAHATAVLLPGAFYYLKETQIPPIELLRKSQIPMAVSTDFNPGSSPVNSLLIAANMACVLFGLTVPEVFAAITTHAAKALGLEKSKGLLQEGFDADLAVWNAEDFAPLVHEIGINRCAGVFTNNGWHPVKNIS